MEVEKPMDKQGLTWNAVGVFILIGILIMALGFFIAHGKMEQYIKEELKDVPILIEKVETLEQQLVDFMINKKDTIVVDVQVLPQSPTHIHIKKE